MTPVPFSSHGRILLASIGVIVIAACAREDSSDTAFPREAPSAPAEEPLPEQKTVRGVLEHYRSDVQSLQAWYGHPFMIGDTPVLPTPEVPEDVLKKHVGNTVVVSGVWYPGERWTATDEERNMPMPVDALEGAVIRGDGLKALTIEVVER